MGKQKTSSWEFKLQMVHLLAKGSHNLSQISRDYQVTRSLRVCLDALLSAPRRSRLRA